VKGNCSTASKILISQVETMYRCRLSTDKLLRNYFMLNLRIQG
jgi:hypothetical protein